MCEFSIKCLNIFLAGDLAGDMAGDFSVANTIACTYDMISENLWCVRYFSRMTTHITIMQLCQAWQHNY